MDRAKHDTDTLGALIISAVVNKRTFCTEAFLRKKVERKVMRILAGVRTDFAENRKMSQEQGFLGNNN